MASVLNPPACTMDRQSSRLLRALAFCVSSSGQLRTSILRVSPGQHLAACRLAALQRRVITAKGALATAQHEAAVQRRLVMVWDAVAVATFR